MRRNFGESQIHPDRGAAVSGNTVRPLKESGLRKLFEGGSEAYASMFVNSRSSRADLIGSDHSSATMNDSQASG